jgi:hypothetical protein
MLIQPQVKVLVGTLAGFGVEPCLPNFFRKTTTVAPAAQKGSGGSVYTIELLAQTPVGIKTSLQGR